MAFYPTARSDGLAELTDADGKMIERFVDREDGLLYRSTLYQITQVFFFLSFFSLNSIVPQNRLILGGLLLGRGKYHRRQYHQSEREIRQQRSYLFFFLQFLLSW